MKNRTTKTISVFSIIILVIIIVHLVFYLIARQQAVHYIDNKYYKMNMKVGWPSQSIFNTIFDGWYSVPVYTVNNGMNIKFYVDLNMFDGIRDDDLLSWAMRADAERQFTKNVQEIIPSATVSVIHLFGADEKSYFEKFGTQNIRYIHNDRSSGSFTYSVFIDWIEKKELSQAEFVTKSEALGKHFLFDYPVYEITFSYKYREDEDTRTFIRSSKDEPLTDDIDVEVLRKNISTVEH